MTDKKNRNKILFVLPTDTFGGAERVIYNLLSGMSTFESVLVTQEAMVPFYSSVGIKIHTFEPFGCLNPTLSFKNILSYTKAIKNLSHVERPGIIFGVMHFATLFSIMARDLFFLRPKIIGSIHGNATSYYESTGRIPTLKERVLLKYCLKRTPHLIVPSVGIKEDLAINFRVRADNIKVLYNGFDLDKIIKLGKEDIPYKKDCPWIAMAARFNTQKDFLTLFKAFSIIRGRIKVKLILIGDGELRKTIRDWIAELKITEDVILTGFQINPYSFIAKSDAFILSSFYEGLPSVVIESMALGVPVVSTDCPSGPSEIIENGENGYLIPVADFHQMAERCLQILTNRDLRKRFSESGRKRSEHFSVQRMQSEYSDYFMHLLS